MAKKTFQDIPERADWSIFGKILGEEIRPPKVNYSEKSAELLKDLLVRCYTTNPDALLRMTCCGKNGSGPLSSYWAKMGNDPRIVQESQSYCLSYLWTKRGDGAACKAKDEVRGTSGNAIQYWDPKAGGIVAYMRERVGYAIGQYVEINAIPKESVSLNKLGEYNLELSDSGTFVRAMESFDEESQDSHDGVLAENFKEFDDSEISEDIDGHGDVDMELDDERHLVEIMEASGILEEEQRIAREARKQAAEIDYKSDNRGDLIWLEKALGYEHDPEPDFDDRMEQLRELSVMAVEKCEDIPLEDRAAILDDLAEWNPAEANFMRVYPEVVDSIQSRDLHMEKEAHIIDYIKNTEGVDGVQSTLGMDTDTKSSVDLLREKNLWRLRSTPELLDSPSRPDFEYLRVALKCEEKPGFDHYSDPRRLQAMGHRYISQRTPDNALGAGLRAGVANWDPTKNFFHEGMMETIADLSCRNKLNEKEMQHAEIMMNPDSVVAKKAVLSMKIEANLDRELKAKSQPENPSTQLDMFGL